MKKLFSLLAVIILLTGCNSNPTVIKEEINTIQRRSYNL